MPPRRKRNASSPPKGLQPGKNLKHDALPNVSSSSPWGWQITPEHRLAACNLSKRNNISICSNKYLRCEAGASPRKSQTPFSGASGELMEDIIVISDDDERPSCSKKDCKSNPYCLNYLGQDMWEDEDSASEKFAELAKVGRGPTRNSRKASLPVGLKNLGATCYANASLQVWYRNLAFRSGVFSCEPPDGVSEDRYKNSPIFQLQVTFAALQEGNRSFYDPTRLVESLQLRATEQQDAQEFSKLFMSHLNAEFKKQPSLDVKSLITKQFQGSLVYGTICHACKNPSERVSDFLEIEINIESNSTLEDRLAASLLPETLSGDNKYFCSHCETLQDATRYTELRELPPVLHFSLLRFIYDVSSMERKKSKHSISFPLTLDMCKFLGSKDARERTAVDRGNYLYELRGILLHKGTSAYHGHYEAQVKDAQHETWFQFNDETVTPIKSLGDTVAHGRATGEKRSHTSEARKNRVNARKRRRIEDTDDENLAENIKPFVTVSLSSTDKSSSVASKDAYMLIYARKHNTEQESVFDCSSSYPKPPIRAMQLVNELNAGHASACDDFQQKQDEMKSRFKDLQRRVRNIYTSWATKDHKNSIVVSRQALEAWLSHKCIEAAIQQKGDIPLSDDTLPATAFPTAVSISDVVCEHGSLDPFKYRDMKCINMHTFKLIEETTNCTFKPLLKASDVCVICTCTIFKEKLYAIRHPKHTMFFEEISPVLDQDELGYWVSKKWCKDWKLIKPRMHVFADNDPGPDSPEFHNDIHCEHGGLSLNITSRRKISSEAAQFLQKLFPSWIPLPSDTETCAICEAEVHIQKGDKKETRKRAEDEKARLRFIHQTSLDSWGDVLESTCHAVIPSLFIKNWKRWVNNPTDQARPDTIDNSQFLCEHGHLLFDPNYSNDLDSSITIIESSQWDALQSMYSCGPLIALTRRPEEDGGGYVHAIPVCEDCRMKRKSEWETADIVIRLCLPEGSKPFNSQSPLKSTKGHSRSNATRQSKRLRQVKEHGQRRRITVSKSTTVKEIKIMASEEFTIPTICQCLYYKGRELEDNTRTVASLQFLANDVLDLREVDEILEITSDSDERPPKRRREGLGFGGTLLGSTDSPYSSSPEETLATNPPNAEKPCITCTFSNQIDAESCEICLAPFS
ncbi:hypothetical protein CPB84DRAFT_1760942 [Gymnopilus junonius]|uniref:Ubiquitinyl hydrolase 1 n=1 Tax=Gymnopilus junonius TaxID=109634 RepID=A0A9P5TU16_GYMJU|nr:hypothetical protein CPB84DRAFT_1760942 [Gymnopilus junonius]